MRSSKKKNDVYTWTHAFQSWFTCSLIKSKSLRVAAQIHNSAKLMRSCSKFHGGISPQKKGWKWCSGGCCHRLPYKICKIESYYWIPNKRLQIKSKTTCVRFWNVFFNFGYKNHLLLISYDNEGIPPTTSCTKWVEDELVKPSHELWDSEHVCSFALPFVWLLALNL